MAIASPALLLVILLLVHLPLSSGDKPFDVRRHLSTVTRYGVVKESNDDTFVPTPIPDGCSAIHLNLVARHGTRAPTKKRIKELDRLAIRLRDILNDAKQEEQGKSMQKIPAWLGGWQSPWKGRQKGGELVSKGEEELYHLGLRVRERFPELFDEDYHPDIFTIKATQVPRASASAVAFGIGLFQGNGNLGPGRNRAFSVISESRASDIHLRFFDSCETYKQYRMNKEPAVEKMKEPVLDQVTSSLVARYQLNFTRQDVASLWFLCKQEASLLETTDQACALFTPSEVALLEWTDDLEGFILKGYGESINYRMGVPLLRDVVHSMEQAIIAKEENYAPGTFEKARLRFAHAETVVPFSCLLGLFLEGSDFEKIRHEKSLSLPPKPPQRRNWRGNLVAPFAGNNMLILYGCPRNNSIASLPPQDLQNQYFVQVLHNEIPVPMPGCNNRDFCPFDLFKETIVNPHLKHDFNSICHVNMGMAEPDMKTVKPCSNIICKLSNLLGRLFAKQDTDGQNKSEL